MSNVSFEYLGIDLGTSFSYIRGVQTSNVKGSGGNTTPQNENVKENYLIDDFTSDHPLSGIWERDSEDPYNSQKFLRRERNRGIQTLIAWDVQQQKFLVGADGQKAQLEYESTENETNGSKKISEKLQIEAELKKKLRNMAADGVKREGNKRKDIMNIVCISDKDEQPNVHVTEEQLSHYALPITRITNDGKERTEYWLATELAVEFLKQIFKYPGTNLCGLVNEWGQGKATRTVELAGMVLGMPSLIQNINYQSFIIDYVITPLFDEIFKYSYRPNFKKSSSSKKASKNPTPDSVPVYVLEEPVLAGYAYQEKWKTYNERTILVVDLGGGTTDFAFIRQEPNSGPLRLLAPSGGGGNPSGKTFDMALAAALRKAIHGDFDDLPDKADQLRLSKEKLFQTKPDVERIGGTYETYLRSGRQHTIEYKHRGETRSVVVAYNESHFNNDEICDAQHYIRYDALCVDIFAHLLNCLDDYLKKNAAIDYDTVLFVGGTSNIIELRTLICSKCLGLIPDNNMYFYESGKKYKSRKKNEKEILVIFDENQDANNKNAPIVPTYSSAIAHGAALASKDGYTERSVFDLFVAFNDDPHTLYPLYSWDIAYGMKKTSVPPNIVHARAESYIKSSENSAEASTSSTNRIYFHIVQKIPGAGFVSYPKGPGYYVTFEKPDETLYIICHPDAHGLPRLYRFLAKPTDNATEAYTYTWKSPFAGPNTPPTDSCSFTFEDIAKPKIQMQAINSFGETSSSQHQGDTELFPLTVIKTGNSEEKKDTTETVTTIDVVSKKKEVAKAPEKERNEADNQEGWYTCSNQNAVKDPSKLVHITIPDGITSIEDLAFGACANLSSISIPKSVTSIGNGAFGCTGLTAVVLPESMTSIGDEAFLGCASLTSIRIPKSVTNIGEGALAGCTSLTDIYFEGTQTQWNAIKKGEDWDQETGEYTVHFVRKGSGKAKSTAATANKQR